MNKNDLDSDYSYQLKVQPRPTQPVTLNIPVDMLESLARIAANRETSIEALLKFYVGQGLRQDLTRRYGERLMESTASVLSRHLESEQAVNEILREIQLESAIED